MGKDCVKEEKGRVEMEDINGANIQKMSEMNRAKMTIMRSYSVEVGIIIMVINRLKKKSFYDNNYYLSERLP